MKGNINRYLVSLALLGISATVTAQDNTTTVPGSGFARTLNAIAAGTSAAAATANVMTGSTVYANPNPNAVANANSNAAVIPTVNPSAVASANNNTAASPNVNSSSVATANNSAAVNPNANAPTNPNANPPAGTPFTVDPKFRPENQLASNAQLESGRVNFLRYCADCHGKEGEGNVGPRLVGSLMVTGPTFGHIAVVLSGHPQTKMPTWGISEISDEVIAGIITYQRNAWGNGNKKEYGKNAGGVVTPSQVHEYRKTLKNLPVKQDVRT